MSGASKKLMGTTAAGGGGALAIEDVFSTYLYSGTDDGSFTISPKLTNGIDLLNNGGMVWFKNRTSTTAFVGHAIWDSERVGQAGQPFGAYINSALSNAEITYADGTNDASPVFEDGITAPAFVNRSGQNYASWTFRKAPRFFDVVTYTGDGTSNRAIPHNLGTDVGFMTVKRTSGVDYWWSWHRTFTQPSYIILNDTGAINPIGYPETVFPINPTDTVFYVDGDVYANTNANGATYVAYLFAHDPLGPSEDGSDGLIACGSYTGNGSSDGPEIDLGWEPQWILTKNASDAYDWYIIDNMRGAPVGVGGTEILKPNTSDAAAVGGIPIYNFSASGFKVAQSGVAFNQNGSTHIYIAIRRGPMRAPESGTEVFGLATKTGNDLPRESTSLEGTDLYLSGFRDTNDYGATIDRMRGQRASRTSLTNSEMTALVYFDGTGGNVRWSGQDWNNSSRPMIDYFFKRAPGFFDVVAYTGDGASSKVVSHNLGSQVDLILVKRRSGGTGDWWTWSSAINPGGLMRLQANSAEEVDNGKFLFGDGVNYINPTDSNFTVTAGGNVSGSNYIAYLFATLPGVSKVGSYTGNGSSQTIDCGFTSGARFVLIKRTDSTGDWYVWDSARGIVAGNDPHLSLNTTAAEVTSDDTIDPDSSGFIVNQVAATNVNVSSASYIYLAIS